MSALGWKWYRYDSIFKQESHALIHKDITNHPLRETANSSLVLLHTHSFHPKSFKTHISLVKF